MNHTEPLVELIFDRLAADRVPDDTAEVVLAALTGEADLAAALAGAPTALSRSAPRRTSRGSGSGSPRSPSPASAASARSAPSPSSPAPG
ncbi:hypothetical protein V2I01_38900 [Micromonospora sp. BRA006-A]|nr:hypothetical protein [Micromonospora sp. BRA006-A]